jgi:hypothetical protein
MMVLLGAGQIKLELWNLLNSKFDDTNKGSSYKYGLDWNNSIIHVLLITSFTKIFIPL